MPKFKVDYTSKVTIVAEVEAASKAAAEHMVSEAGLETLLQEHGLNDEADVKIVAYEG